jgi:uncharacterized phage protein (TIGR02218 family)
VTYLSRPVFTFRPNWRSTPTPSFSYDLRAISNDWGPLAFAMLQQKVVRGWEFGLSLNTIAEIVAFETFCDATKGRLNGFWFPAPEALALIISGSGDEIVIQDQDLRSTWDATGKVPLHVWIARDKTDAPFVAAVTDVTVGGTGEEIITLDDTLPADIDATWRITALSYARFASDEEEADWLEEGRQVRQLRVIELTQDYAAYETGLLKVYLYRFYYGDPGTAVDGTNDWFYTSFQTAISSTLAGAVASKSHTSIPINHGALRFSIENTKIEAQITDLVYDADAPWSRQRTSLRSAYPALWVQIRSADYATPNSTTLLFTGEVTKFPSQGKRYRAQCVGGVDADDIRVPCSRRGMSCRLHVFDAATCKKSDSGHKVTATVSAVNGLVITLTAAGFSGKAANWYARGKIQLGTGRDLRRGVALRSTAASGTSIDVVLNQDLLLNVSDTLDIWPGCDGLKETCTTKFDNFVNFDGHPLVPVTNSATDSLSTTPTTPNKK